MSAPRSRAKIKLPGLEIGIRQGAGPVAEDIPFLGTHLASEARRLLDNMTPSRARTGPARTLGPDVVEKRLDSLCTTHGVSHLNVIRDNARAVAPLIGDRKSTRLNSSHKCAYRMPS